MNSILVNVQSLIPNLTKVELLISDLMPEIVCCTESRVTEEINDGEININGYNCIRSNLMTRYSGGVVIYYKKYISINVLSDIVYGYNNILVFEIKNTIFKGIWFVVYHSPSSSHSQFLEKFEEICNDFIMSNKMTYIVGDFNINMHRSNALPSHKNRLKQIVSTHYLSQKVRNKTYIRNDCKSIAFALLLISLVAFIIIFIS